MYTQQRRTRTVAEGKRAMGFPDSYLLSGTAEEVSWHKSSTSANRIQMDAQLGNAWVVPMGQAILGAIRDVIREEWLEAGCPEELFAWWRTAHPVATRKA
jgi:site-specific DNA-cytosine methylase